MKPVRPYLRIDAILLPAVLAGVFLLASGGADTPPTPDTAPGMSVGQAAILGLVEGVTEFLPISSTGHLILAQRAMGIGGSNGDAEAADAYAIVIQAGAILAVLGVYAGIIRRIAAGLVGRDTEGTQLARNLVVAFVPAAFVGLLLADAIKQHLFSLWTVVAAWLVGGVAILVMSRWRGESDPERGSDLMNLGWQPALVIGVIQCAAMWPGMSRSLVTIVGGILVGMNLRSAVIFSFLLGAVTLGAGTAYDMVRHGAALLDAYGAASLATGFFVALISAIVAVKWLVAYLKKHGLEVFGYYRVGIAIVVAGLIFAGVMDGS